MTKKIISLAIFVVMFIASLSGGIYANVRAFQENTLYKEQVHYTEKYSKLYDKSVNADNPIVGSQYFKNHYQEKTEEAKTKANEYKKSVRKYFAFAAILIFVAVAMCICTIVTAITMFKNKQPKKEKSEDKPKEVKKSKPAKVKAEQKPEPSETTKERPKSDFDLILEAPKPSIKDIENK